MTARALLKGMTRNHARACRCGFCAVLRALPDRERVLAITRARTALHEDDCVCVMCQTERLVEGEREVWDVDKPQEVLGNVN